LGWASEDGCLGRCAWRPSFPLPAGAEPNDDHRIGEHEAPLAGTPQEPLGIATSVAVYPVMIRSTILCRADGGRNLESRRSHFASDPTV
jgi:hypothetical protein